MDRQEAVDRWYWRHGPCCAGCDWWRHINSVGGVCEADPIPDVTTRDHVCARFKDGFDWSSLPLAYRKKIGVVEGCHEPVPRNTPTK